MSMTIAAATARIARQLPEAELSLDSALLASARLMESMLLARQADGVETFTGQTALMRLAKAQRTLIESQNDMIRVHQELRGVGLEVKAITDDAGTCPKESGLAVAEPMLRSA
ncbi:hypothetical protein QUC32_15015 [Novosphingobium resinovorum]|jgi:hypothetical protein|uniref:Uncharacterized protein n=1 Tax=Novosphingobium resinovorum TaxID=158500 RepID=A0A031K5V6_9SPHN|nr:MULTISPECIES: hypothetical protein [Sphingomonadaceae]AOR75645.1 hypothetical protein BES08_01895 [Novosphingobium resinovorum]EJU11685.1 hypothetical protein LH128_17682 [Sphingomonas sp. LH128]EZP84609.1 hypothetical protein BV97_00365 [Novosphingobium resinovorum]MBF7010977.1 hypothetical protein [Novosphingobium sp. HR1a]WJM28971.1 hypothetical protein QUC32_15015 [Novosphingobium resinovorum]